MPRGNAGKAPHRKRPHRCPHREKGPSALSAERFGKEDAAAQGGILQAQGHEKVTGRAFSLPGSVAGGSRKRKKALRQAVPAEKRPENALLSAWAV